MMPHEVKSELMEEDYHAIQESESDLSSNSGPVDLSEGALKVSIAGLHSDPLPTLPAQVRELPGTGQVAAVMADGKIQVYEIQPAEVVTGMDEGSTSDYNIVHLEPGEVGL